MHDVRAVMDAAGSQRAALIGVSEGGPMMMLMAATYPERVSALVLVGTFVRSLWPRTGRWASPTPRQRKD
jgi:pimeloyl-ACP methyl ester carboxylesterase